MNPLDSRNLIVASKSVERLMEDSKEGSRANTVRIVEKRESRAQMRTNAFWSSSCPDVVDRRVNVLE